MATLEKRLRLTDMNYISPTHMYITYMGRGFHHADHAFNM